MRNLMLAAIAAALLATPALAQNTESTPASQLRPKDRQASGTISAASGGTCPGTGCVCIYNSGHATALTTVTGIGSMTLTFRGKQPDGTLVSLYSTPQGGGAPVLTTTANGTWLTTTVGYPWFCIDATAFTSGTATVNVEVSPRAYLGFATAAAMAAQSGSQGQLVTLPGGWGVQHQPAAATQATIAKAAGTGTVRHVATSATVCISAVAAQPDIIFNLRDGATGAGTIVWSVRLANPTVGSSTCVPSPPLNIVGTAATAMTLESAAAPATSNFATVSLTGYDVN